MVLRAENNFEFDCSESQTTVKNIPAKARNSFFRLGIQEHSMSMTHTARETGYGAPAGHIAALSEANFPWTFQAFPAAGDVRC